MTENVQLRADMDHQSGDETDVRSVSTSENERTDHLLHISEPEVKWNVDIVRIPSIQWQFDRGAIIAAIEVPA